LTYNFDPDRWYDNERSLLDIQLAAEKITPDQFTAALAGLDERYDEMVERLDGTFQLPESDDR